MMKTKKCKGLVLEYTCIFGYQVSTDRQTLNSDLDLPDLAETAKLFIAKNSNDVSFKEQEYCHLK